VGDEDTAEDRFEGKKGKLAIVQARSGGIRTKVVVRECGEKTDVDRHGRRETTTLRKSGELTLVLSKWNQYILRASRVGESLELGREVRAEDTDFRSILGKNMCLSSDLPILLIGISPKDIIKDTCEDLATKMLIVYSSKRLETFYKLL
jgi:hypothetical protein